MIKSKTGLDQEVCELLRMKAEQNEAISLVIPTLNEAECVGGIIREIENTLMGAVPLVDEILVFDGGSTDGTAEIVGQTSAGFYSAVEGIGGSHWKNGKGLALWRSQFYVHGSVVIFIDGDIQNFTADFVTALIRPFLADPATGFVKAYYERPIMENGVLHSRGGGRVTELLVRPIFSYFFPEAAHLRQPLSGEYGFRLDRMRHLLFYTGYGVETSLVIDYIQTYGADTISEVNLGRRVHRNRSLEDLGRMSYTILQTVIDLADATKSVDKRFLDYSGYRCLNGADVELVQDLLQERLPRGCSVK
ncbi:MAG: glucosyl-3-phosphoglycerate synthase [Fibrobacterota bacterium]